MTTTIEWTEIGDGVMGRGFVTNAIAALDWHTLPTTLAGMAGLGIKQCIAEFTIPKVARVAVGSVGRYGFYGVEGHWADGARRIYFIDRGGDIVPVATQKVSL